MGREPPGRAVAFANPSDRLLDIDWIEDPFASGSWRKVRVCGEAQFGSKVLQVANMSMDDLLGLPEQFAVKRIKKVNIFDKPGLECPQNEMRAALKIRRLQCEYTGSCGDMIKVLGVWQDKVYFYLVTEWCPNELFNVVKCGEKMNESELRDVCKMMLSAVAGLHGNGLAHRDATLENFVTSAEPGGNRTVRLIDLGQAVHNSSGLASADQRTIPGKTNYLPPELWPALTAGSTVAYSPTKLDVFQVGIAIFALMVGNYPYDLKMIASGNKWLYPDRSLDRCSQIRPLLSAWGKVDTVPADSMDLLERLLAPNPDLRITAAEALEHEWFCVGQTASADSGLEAASGDTSLVSDDLDKPEPKEHADLPAILRIQSVMRRRYAASTISTLREELKPSLSN